MCIFVTSKKIDDDEINLLFHDDEIKLKFQTLLMSPWVCVFVLVNLILGYC